MNIYHGHYDAAGCTKQAMQAAKKARTDKGSRRAAHYNVRKKKYRTFIDQSALKQNHVVFSGGKIGIQIEMDPQALIDVFHVTPFDLVFD